MAGTQPMNFILEAFQHTVTLDLCGNIFSQVVGALDASATAILYVNTADIKNVFKFQTDSTDVNNLNDADLQYYVYPDEWPLLNPANAMLDDAGASNPIASADAAAVTLPANKMMVAHDFTRYLADELFNTHLGVDLFDNEVELLQSIRRACDNSAAGHTLFDIVNVLKNVGVDGDGSEPDAGLEGAAGSKYMTNSTADDAEANKKNVCRVIFNQMTSANGVNRFSDILTGMVTAGTSVASLPFVTGDSISFKLIINPAEDQNDLTAINEFGSRSYEIKLILADDNTAAGTSNTEVSEDETVATHTTS